VHARRKIYEFYESTKSPLAREVLERIGPLFEIEARINGQAPERRLAVRQAEAIRSWLNSRTSWTTS
jgi:transposase